MKLYYGLLVFYKAILCSKVKCNGGIDFSGGEFVALSFKRQ